MTASDILDFEFRRLGVETKFLDNAGVLVRCQPRLSSDFVAITTVFPNAKIKAVDLGSQVVITTARKNIVEVDRRRGFS